MSTDIFLKNHVRNLLQASKVSYTTKLQEFNERVLSSFEDVNRELTNLTNRVAALEQFLNDSRLFIDADGNIAQNDSI